MKKYLTGFVLCCTLTGCLSSGPEKTLQDMAKALTDRDVSTFLAHMDMKRYADGQLRNTTQENTALKALNDVTKMLGLGGVDALLGSVVDSQQAFTEDFSRGVSTGELINQCTRAQNPHCPWVPESLRAAKVKELSKSSAVAQVTTPAGMTSWLALTKQGDIWKVVGQTVLEKDAVAALTLSDNTELKSGKSTQPTPTPQKIQPQQPTAPKNDPYAPAPPPAPVTKL